MMDGVSNFIQFKSNNKVKMGPNMDFFNLWVEFTRPLHKLTKKESMILAVMLYERYKISKKYPEDIVDSILLNKETRQIICNQCNIKPKHLNVTLSKFRDNGVLRNEKVFLYLIPNIDKNGVRLFINFDFKNSEQQLVKLGPQASSKKA